MWCGLYIAFKNRLISYVSEAENTGEKWKFSVRVESNRVCDAALARREFVQGSQSDFYIYIERERVFVCVNSAQTSFLLIVKMVYQRQLAKEICMPAGACKQPSAYP